MADIKWIGGAPTKAEVQTATIGGTWSAGETITATVGGRSITVTLGATSAGSVTAVADALEAAWNGAAVTADETRDFTGSQFNEMSDITLSNVAGGLTFTADTAGIPFTVTLSETAASGTVSSMTIATAATGPNDWANKRNWSTNTVPVNSDVVFFEDTDVDVLYGLDQSAVTLTSLHIHSTYTGNIGLDSMRDRGEETEHKEYRRLALKLGGTVTVHIGKGDGEGSPRIRIEFATAAASANVYSTGDSLVDSHPGLFLTGGTSAIANIYGGTVWIGVEGGNATNFTSVIVSGTEEETPEVSIGYGGSGTASTITVANATVVVDSAAGTLNVHSGALATLIPAYSTGNITMSTGGAIRLVGVAKTLASITVFSGGHLDATGFINGITTSGLFLCYDGSTVTLPEGASVGTISIATGSTIASSVNPNGVTLNLPIRSSTIIDYVN